MGDRIPPLKPDEQYPLLKIDGGGDMSHAQPPQTVVTPGLGVTCRKNSRLSRWPEFISVCWMSLILCGISFLVFRTLGMGLYRRQQVIVMKCNTTNPANNVYYHHIVQRGSQVPLVLYSEYLADMAKQYPLLQFKVIFLIDDFYLDALRGPKRNIPIHQSWLYNYKLDEIGKKFDELLRRYNNINMIIMPLSKFMATTPLKFKWRLIPQAHLTFFARVFSVWQNGGIGIDLRTFNDDYHTHYLSDPRIDTILRQHSDGINHEEYTKALNKIDNDESNAIFTRFAGLINDLLNNTRSFFNRTLSFCSIPSEKSPLTRAHRSKRQAKNESDDAVITSENNNFKTFYNIDDNASNLVSTNYTKAKNESIDVSKNTTTEPVRKSANSTDIKKSKSHGNGSELHEVVLFYDFTILSDNTGPSLPSFFIHKPSAVPKSISHLLSIDAEGMFIAASAKFHPFLAYLISAGSFGMPPNLAIQDALLTQCSGIIKDDVYCNSIYVFNNY